MPELTAIPQLTDTGAAYQLPFSSDILPGQDNQVQALNAPCPAIKPLHWCDIPIARGMTAAYIHIYREWLDQQEPDHHLILITRKYRNSIQNYVRLSVKCKALNIKIEEEFIYHDALSLETAKRSARKQRAQLPDDIFCLIRRAEPEVPGIYHYPKQQCFKADISNGEKRVYKTFSYRYSPVTEAYDRSVKALFDARSISYPERLFANLGIVPHGALQPGQTRKLHPITLNYNELLALNDLSS